MMFPELQDKAVIALADEVHVAVARIKSAKTYQRVGKIILVIGVIAIVMLGFIVRVEYDNLQHERLNLTRVRQHTFRADFEITKDGNMIYFPTGTVVETARCPGAYCVRVVRPK